MQPLVRGPIRPEPLHEREGVRADPVDRPHSRLSADETNLGEIVGVLEVDLENLAFLGSRRTFKLRLGVCDEDVGVQRWMGVLGHRMTGGPAERLTSSCGQGDSIESGVFGL